MPLEIDRSAMACVCKVVHGTPLAAKAERSVVAAVAKSPFGCCSFVFNGMYGGTIRSYTSWFYSVA